MRETVGWGIETTCCDAAIETMLNWIFTMQCCVLALLTKLRFSNTYAEGSELCTGEENGYKITEFKDTPAIKSTLHVVWFGVKEWTLSNEPYESISRVVVGRLEAIRVPRRYTNIKNVTNSEISQSIARAQEMNKLLEGPTQPHDQWQNYVIEGRESQESFEDIVEPWLNSASDNNDMMSHDIRNL